MPKGVYERQSWMQNSGKTREIKPDVLEALESGLSTREVGRRFKIAKSTVTRLKTGIWNEGRKRKTNNAAD